LRRNRIAVERDGRLPRTASHQLIRHTIAQLEERPQHVLLHEIPLRLGRMPLELGPDAAGPLANAGGLGPELRIIDHLLDIAEPVGPLSELLAGERRELADRGIVRIAVALGAVG
jgi:hypothetical protein